MGGGSGVNSDWVVLVIQGKDLCKVWDVIYLQSHGHLWDLPSTRKDFVRGTSKLQR